MLYFTIVIKLLIALLVLLLDNSKIKWKSKWGKKVLYVIIAMLALDSFISVYTGRSADEKNNETYLLAKCNSNTGIISSLKKSNSSYPVLLTGSGKKAFFKWMGSKDKPIFQLTGENIFLEMVSGKASISFDLRNKKGKLIGYIINNEWHVSRNEVIDVNYSQDTLEIIDKDNEIFLQLHISGEKVWLSGTFYGKAPSKQRLELKPWLKDGNDWEARIFKYPSCSHFGEENI